jgi:uroporphyrinogen III methyltransferase / synthase
VTVFLVGSGPGDADLITVRGARLLAAADVVVHDRLVEGSMLELVNRDAELIDVGKEPGRFTSQSMINELLVALGRRYQTVVRLKGGDPFVFGRGGEEALALRQAGIPFEIVPGVTSGVAAAAYAGIPVTHRGLATAVALVTGHTRADQGRDAASAELSGDPTTGAPDRAETDIDWTALAAFPGTLVFYMGVRQLPQIAESLIAAGRPADEPVAIVERGTLPDQRTVTGTLQDIAEVAERERVRAPSITVVGPVAGLTEELEWLPERPLSGLTVAVTRARAQASGLARRLEELGASVVQAPAIRVQAISDPTDTAVDLSPYDLVCFTSPNAVDALFERLTQQASSSPAAHPRDARAFAGVRIAAIGPGTARALAEHGLIADIVPERFVAESFVEALLDVPIERALVARAKEARDVIPDALRARGAQVDILALYETVAEPLSPRTLADAQAADYITFTSSSTVRFFLEAAAGGDSLSPDTRIVSIGPVTSDTLREHGLEPHVEAADHDVNGVIQALRADTARQQD